jgi:hypothetical protein
MSLQGYSIVGIKILSQMLYFVEQCRFKTDTHLESQNATLLENRVLAYVTGSDEAVLGEGGP